MAFYRKNLKWHHRLWNVFATSIELVLLLLYVILLAIPTYIIAGDNKVYDTADNLFCLLDFTDNPIYGKLF